MGKIVRLKFLNYFYVEYQSNKSGEKEYSEEARLPQPSIFQLFNILK